MYRVGGCVRDAALGIKSKDIDWSVVAPDITADPWETYCAMYQWLQLQGYTIFTDSEEHFTIRAKFPEAMNMPKGEQDADFVLARSEGPYSDGRHPDWVKLGTFEDDINRRDFTVNAMAEDLEGNLIDLHGGMQDLEHMQLRCVGEAEDRLREDALRALRAIRFRITKGFTWVPSLREAMCSEWLPPLLSSVKTERKRDELMKCFRKDTIETLNILCHEVSPDFLDACLGDTGPNSLWLMPSMEGRGNR